MFIKIQSKGEIDLNAFVLMGASTKREDDSKIGMFGSGNKYALACLIRENIPFRIMQGLHEVKISTSPELFRDKYYNKILIDDKVTSLTVEMGPQWTPWMAFREIYCNALDEEITELRFNYNGEQEGKEGHTTFYIEQKQMQNMIDNWNEYYSTMRTPELEINSKNGIIKAYPSANKEKCIFYRRGIRVYETKENSLYDYDLEDCEINESRVCEDPMKARRFVTEALTQAMTPKLFMRIIKDKNAEFEKKLWWSFYNSCKLSPEMKSFFLEHQLFNEDNAGNYKGIYAKADNPLILPSEIAKMIADNFPEITVYGLNASKNSKQTHFFPEEDQQQYEIIIESILTFMVMAEYQIVQKIVFGTFTSVDVLGRAIDNEIQLSVNLIGREFPEILSAVIEENEHLKTGYGDMTREFQNHIFSLLTKYMKKFTSEKHKNSISYLQTDYKEKHFSEKWGNNVR